MPQTVPGLFVGWQLELGLHYRYVLLIADFERVRKGHWEWSSVHSVPEAEVYFPAEVELPFATAREQALKELKSSTAKDVMVPYVPLLPSVKVKVKPPKMRK